MNSLTDKQQRQATESARAFRELKDKLYELAEWAGMQDDWVQTTAKAIEKEVEETTGITLGEF